MNTAPFGKGSKKRHDAAVKAARTKRENAKKKKSRESNKKKKITKKTYSLSPGKKSAETKAKNYAAASADERARIDEIRHQAAIKAAETKRRMKGVQTKKGIPKKIDRSAAVEKAENTGKAAMEITKWRINQLESRTRWQLIEFMGKKGKESAGIVDILAIRKDHEKKLKEVKLKPGDLFEIIPIQVKGGNASLPSSDEINRLQRVAMYYSAKNVALFKWKNEQLTLYRLKNFEYRKKLNPREAWIKVSSLSEFFP